jgi:cobalt/nickel transport system ATP-binding protein
MPENIFELEDVEFTYLGKFTGLNKINLEVKQGESIAILGANGSGKSTLLHLLAGLIYSEKGYAKAFGRILDKNVFDDEEFRRFFRSKVVLLFQNTEAQLFSSDVTEELYFGPLQLDLPPAEIRNSIIKLATLLGIKKLFDRSPHQLSMGEKKKVAIASILAINPEVLLLDEPTAGLDPRTTRELIDLILTYHHGEGKTVITATHDLHIVSEIADKIYILNEEKAIAASGACKEILSNQELLNKYNLVHIHPHMHEESWHKHPHQHGVKQ